MTIDYKPEGLSFSSASSFKQCPKKYSMEKIYRRELITTSYPTTLGSFVHEVFEYFYKLDPGKRTRENLRLLASEVHSEFTEQDDYKMLYMNDDMKRKFKHDAWNYLDDIFYHEDPTRVDVIETEMDFLEVLKGSDGKEIPFKGQIDRVDDEGEKGLKVTDYKSGKMPKKQYMGQKTPQIMLYSAVVKKVLGVMPTTAQFIFLGGETVPYHPTDKMVDKEIDKLGSIWDELHIAIEDEEFEARPSMLCGWCPHVDICEEGQEEVKRFLAMGRMKSTAPAIDILDLYHLVR